MFIEKIHEHQTRGEEAKENKEGPAAATFRQGAVLAHEDTGEFDFAVDVVVVVGVGHGCWMLFVGGLFLFSFAEDRPNNEEGDNRDKDDYDGNGKLMAVLLDD